MTITRLAIVVFVTFFRMSCAVPNSFSPLPNCTNYKNCISPFNFCDNLTGACQFTSRNAETTRKNYWSESKGELDPYYDRMTSTVCSDDGNYPSDDCRYFYQCVNGNRTLRSCNSPGFPYFDPVTERCSSSSTCPSFRCFGRFDVRVGLEGQMTPFFAYCFPPMYYEYAYGSNYFRLSSGLRNVFIPYVVTRCYGKDILNENTGRCEPRCLQEGLLPDTSDCHNYFLCSLQDPVTTVFTMARLSCPQGQAFLYEEHRCVPEDRVSACTTPRAWPL